jgi:hypothetical protein
MHADMPMTRKSLQSQSLQSNSLRPMPRKSILQSLRPRASIAVLSLVAVLAALSPIFATPSRASLHVRNDDPAIAADLAILRALDVPFAEPKVFRNADAGAVVALVREATGLVIEVDRAIVGDSGGWEFTSVDCDAATPRVALDAVARAISTSYREMVLEVVAGIAIFTDNDRASRITAIRRYNLAPILMRLDASDANPAGRRTKIASMVVEAIDRDGWREHGGEVSWLEHVGDTLVVSTTPSRHHRIEQFLDGVARALPTPTLRWTVTIAEIDPAVSEADLARVLDSAAELDALVALGGARIQARPSIVAPRHDEARVDVSAAADGDNRSLSVAVKPVGGVASFSVHVVDRGARGTRAITLRAIEGLRCAGVIDAGGSRLLVAAIAESVLPASNDGSVNAIGAERGEPDGEKKEHSAP